MLKKFKNSDNLSKNLAEYILEKIKKKRKFLLGCPSGRSLKKTYKYIGIISYKKNIDLSNLKIFMMDEFVFKDKKNKFKLCNSNTHYSCIGYSYKTIMKFLNYKKTKKRITKENIYFPDVKNPKNYDKIIKKFGGIDIFLLASGSTDGHVAFNNIKSKLNSKTHITKLSNETRADNMKSFKKFRYISDVPKYGITVGLGTIYKLSKQAILVLFGKEKRNATKVILNSKKFNKNWPSTIIYKCKRKIIYIDKQSDE